MNHLRGNFKISILIFVLSCCATYAGMSQNWSKKFNRMDKLAVKGDYKLAHELTQNLKIKIRSDLGPQSAYMALANFRDADYLGGAGYIEEYRKVINRGFSTARGTTGTNKIEFARISVEGVKILVKYGDFATALKYVQELDSIIIKFKIQDPFLLLENELSRAYILQFQGAPNEALNILTACHEDMIRLYQQTQRTEQFIGNQFGKKYSLTNFEIKQNKRAYAYYLTGLGDIYLDLQNNKLADSIFQYATQWIKEELSASDISMINLRFHQIVKQKAVTTNDGTIKELESLLKSAAHLNRNQFLMMNIKFYLLEYYLSAKMYDKFDNLQKDLAKINEKYYDDTNINTARLQLISLKDPRDSLNYALNVNAIEMMFKNSKALPEYHDVTIKTYEYLVELAENGNESEEKIQDYRNKIMKIKTHLYGEGFDKVKTQVYF